jgi:hypothetical protein
MCAPCPGALPPMFPTLKIGRLRITSPSCYLGSTRHCPPGFDVGWLPFGQHQSLPSACCGISSPVYGIPIMVGQLASLHFSAGFGFVISHASNFSPGSGTTWRHEDGRYRYATPTIKITLTDTTATTLDLLKGVQGILPPLPFERGHTESPAAKMLDVVKPMRRAPDAISAALVASIRSSGLRTASGRD